MIKINDKVNIDLKKVNFFTINDFYRITKNYWPLATIKQ
jgi:hypothetical protein